MYLKGTRNFAISSLEKIMIISKKKSDYSVVQKNENEVEQDSQNEKKKVSLSCEDIFHMMCNQINAELYNIRIKVVSNGYVN